MRPAKQNKLSVGHGPAVGSVRAPPMLDCLGEAIRQMRELMRRELDDVRSDHEQLRSELADVTTIFRDIRRRAGLAAERVADHLGSVIPVVLIARKAGLAEFLQYPSKAKVDIVRADARLAICSLADSIARNARTIREDRHDKVVDTSLLWARAIDLCDAWMRAAE
jgi:hypothetical protein